MRLRRRLLLLVLGLALGLPASASAQGSQDVDPGDTPATALGPVELDRPYRGVLETPGDLDVFRVEVPDGIQAVRVELAQTNTTCEVWGSLLNNIGSELSRAYAPLGGISLVQDSVEPSSFFMVVDHGDLVECSGAEYVVTFHVVSVVTTALGPSSSLLGNPTANASAVFWCETYCRAASKKATEKRKVRRRLAHASPADRDRLEARLHKLRRQYRKLHRLEIRWCDRARLGDAG